MTMPRLRAKARHQQVEAAKLEIAETERGALIERVVLIGYGYSYKLSLWVIQTS